jgi:hypothetical protein
LDAADPAESSARSDGRGRRIGREGASQFIVLGLPVGYHLGGFRVFGEMAFHALALGLAEEAVGIGVQVRFGDGAALAHLGLRK